MRITFFLSLITLGASAPSVLAQTATALPYNAVSDVAPAAPAGGYAATNLYQHDDDTCENALGWTTGGDFAFLQKFSAVGGNDVINKGTMCQFGTPTGTGGPPVGTTVKIFVWDDPTDDISPYDCVLVGQSTGVVTNTGTGIFDSVSVPPCPVVNDFYVGVSVFCAVGQFVGPMDTTAVVPNAAWLTGTNAQGGYTGVPINGDKGLTRMSTSGFPCNWMLRAEGGSPDVTYCTAKTNSLGCTPAIGSLGVGSATATSGHYVRSVNNRNNKNGLLFYGVNGQASTPYQGGTLCVKTPIKRTPSTNSGGTPAPANDCTGVYQLDMNAFAQGLVPGGTPLAALTVPGTVVDCQWWGRDPGFVAPNNTSLSDGLEYIVGP